MSTAHRDSFTKRTSFPLFSICKIYLMKWNYLENLLWFCCWSGLKFLLLLVVWKLNVNEYSLFIGLWKRSFRRFLWLEGFWSIKRQNFSFNDGPGMDLLRKKVKNNDLVPVSWWITHIFHLNSIKKWEISIWTRLCFQMSF